ncbi:MAG: lipocalin [Bacteroidetes bacterium]|nr:lipocalin [Bacteroidota bacterium]
MGKKKISVMAISVISLCLLGCKVFKPIEGRRDAVKPFDVDKYLGKWYEICRLDFYWEKGLSQVTAEYSKNPDGTIQVNNRGFSDKKGKWQQSIGKAKPVSGITTGALKVSFFGPFYGGYNVVKIDPKYKYALVFGKNTDYMWILSREKTIPDSIKDEYIQYAIQTGCDTSELVWTRQE